MKKLRSIRVLPMLVKMCIICDKEFETKLDRRIACSRSCGAIHNHEIRTTEEKIRINQKREKTCIEKYGNKHVVNSKHTKEKTKEKLGVEYPWQSPVVLQGIKTRYKEKHGCENPMQNPEVTGRMIATKIKKYGGLDTFNHYKEYVFPSGRTEKVQGYEPHAIDDLLKTHHESDIVVGREAIKSHIGNVKYFSEKTSRTHYYYPDIYVISEKKVIEVKSKWTYEKQKETNELKKSAVLEKGILFDFMIY